VEGLVIGLPIAMHEHTQMDTIYPENELNPIQSIDSKNGASETVRRSSICDFRCWVH